MRDGGLLGQVLEAQTGQGEEGAVLEQRLKAKLMGDLGTGLSTCRL